MAAPHGGLHHLYLVRKIIVYRTLRQFKGPWGAGFIEIAHTIKYLGPQCHEWYRDRLQGEIDEAVKGNRGVVSKETGIVTHAAARQMPYLQAVIREGMRVFPPMLLIAPRVVPPGGDTVVVDGEEVFLPGRVEVGQSALAFHQSKGIFGEDARVFRPERWLEGDREKLAGMVRVSDLMFSHSKWQCLRKQVAMVELSKVFFELLRNFDFALIDPKKPWKMRNANGVFLIEQMWARGDGTRNVIVGIG
ncbi:cytochrome P450 [Bombardia bombarda]|uniref:Cytochrome P450 n=1 Tax=Bombardia bombarda TaxID=252184 RepID=A0AA40C4Z3_9PEZI|nr:cytochrome P450 [Bombardia bombarda]